MGKFAIGVVLGAVGGVIIGMVFFKNYYEKKSDQVYIDSVNGLKEALCSE